ncbi:hypothetical protein KIW84_065356 [Lathyrus oleraceus]|uniref:Retrovirus-related Pol polyprotein from transposon TNT 1-94-like beta-barrel domain-containing protein n=1 Tax=Pisum sativum TaxID=3888 RepID=A0A9D4WEV3_PEA|nr:hypothetical protein KIW84_065356 [Pisum sativum]
MQFLNSGYNNHMSGINEWFPDLDESFRQSTKLNNDTRRTILEKGSVRMQMNGVGHNDIEGEGESNDDDEGNVADVRESTESSSTSSESHEDESLVMNEGMVRRVSSWMENYETFEGLSNEDGLNAMITLTKDNSLTFEEAVKSKE